MSAHRKAAGLLLAASATPATLHFRDYSFGIAVLLALGLLHIVLDFPLDGRALRRPGAAAIGQIATQMAHRRA